jgi:hypothetical protein
VFQGATGLIGIYNGVGGLTGDSNFTHKFVPSVLAAGTITAWDLGVTGIGTSFTTDLKRTETIQLQGGGSLPPISAIVNSNYLTLESFSGFVGPTGFYTSARNQITVDADIIPTKSDYFSIGSKEYPFDKVWVGPGCLEMISDDKTVTARFAIDLEKPTPLLNSNLSMEAPSFYVGTFDTPGWIIGNDSNFNLVATKYNGHTGTSVYQLTPQFQSGVFDTFGASSGVLIFSTPFSLSPVVHITQETTGSIIPLSLTAVSVTQFSWQSSSGGVGMIHWTATTRNT